MYGGGGYRRTDGWCLPASMHMHAQIVKGEAGHMVSACVPYKPLPTHTSTHPWPIQAPANQRPSTPWISVMRRCASSVSGVNCGCPSRSTCMGGEGKELSEGIV